MKSIFNLRKAGLLAATAAVLFTACKKDSTPDNNGNPPPGGNSTKLAKVSMDNESLEFTYGGDGAVQSIKMSNEFITGGVPSTFTVSYTADKKVSELKSADGTRFVAHYTGNQLSTSDMYDGNTLALTTKYEYQNGELKSATCSVGAIEALKFSFLYNAAGTISKMVLYSFDPATGMLQPTGYTEYTYDTKANPLHDHKQLLYLLLQNVSKNNTAKEMSYDDNNQLEETKEYTYQYNSQNLPQSATVKTTVPGQAATTSTLLFSYK